MLAPSAQERKGVPLNLCHQRTYSFYLRSLDQVHPFATRISLHHATPLLRTDLWRVHAKPIPTTEYSKAEGLASRQQASSFNTFTDELLGGPENRMKRIKQRLFSFHPHEYSHTQAKRCPDRPDRPREKYWGYVPAVVEKGVPNLNHHRFWRIIAHALESMLEQPISHE